MIIIGLLDSTLEEGLGIKTGQDRWGGVAEAGHTQGGAHAEEYEQTHTRSFVLRIYTPLHNVHFISVSTPHIDTSSSA